MSVSMDHRVLALAGVAQALQQVRRIAETGHSEAATVRTAMDSVFRVDAASPEAVYGSAAAVAPGLRLLHNYFRNQGQDDVLPRLALAVLQLERRFVRDTATRPPSPAESTRRHARRSNWATATIPMC